MATIPENIYAASPELQARIINSCITASPTLTGTLVSATTSSSSPISSFALFKNQVEQTIKVAMGTRSNWTSTEAQVTAAFKDIITYMIQQSVVSANSQLLGVSMGSMITITMDLQSPDYAHVYRHTQVIIPTPSSLAPYTGEPLAKGVSRDDINLDADTTADDDDPDSAWERGRQIL